MRRPTSRPSRIEPVHFGLDPERHFPVDEPKPMRRGPSRVKMFTKRAARGYVYAHDAVQVIGMVHALTDPGTRVVADRPHAILVHAFRANGSVATFRHVPDFAVLRDDGTVMVVDFARRATRLGPPRLRRAELLRAAYLEDHGILYCDLDDVTLKVAPLFPNLEIVYAQTKGDADPEALVAVRGALMALGLPTTVGELRRAVSLPTGFEGTDCESQYDRVMPTVSEMAVCGELRIDHRTYLSDATVLLPPRGGRL
ncbi:hypothetical protein [uncultured Aureimonas sp.]|uniref:hypothetical protein n=1 Tax=uncultured Aureimonas sp. TaxID=1604662 RepID=UPI0025FCF4D1|nr:hypothetical protein [uncultured Aureimonas sp.]